MAGYNPSAFGPLTPEQAVQAIKNVPYGNTVTEHYLLFWDSAQSRYHMSYYQSDVINCTGSVYSTSGSNRIMYPNGTASIFITVNAQGGVTGYGSSGGQYTNYADLAGEMSGYAQDWSTANVYSTIHLNVPENPAYSLNPTEAPDERIFAKDYGTYKMIVGVAVNQNSTYDNYVYTTQTYKIRLRWTSLRSGVEYTMPLSGMLTYSVAAVLTPSTIPPLTVYSFSYSMDNAAPYALALRMPVGAYSAAADIPTAYGDLTDIRALTEITLQQLVTYMQTVTAGANEQDAFTEIFADFMSVNDTVIETKSCDYSSLFGDTDVDISGGTISDPNDADSISDTNLYTDSIDLTTPTLTATGVFNRCYVMDGNGVNDLCDYLYNASDSIFEEIIDGVLTRGNPIESIIDLRLYPFDVRSFTGAGTSEFIKFGRTVTSVVGIKLPHNSNAVISLGSCVVPRYYNNFLDYEMDVKLYIPFCGVCDLPIDRVLNHTLSIKLIVDYITGACCAVVYVDNIPITYQSGVIGVSIPLTATDSAEFGKAIIGNLITGAAQIAQGNPASAVGPLTDAATKMWNGSSIQTAGASSPQVSLYQPKNAYLLLSIVNPPDGVYSDVYASTIGYESFMPVSAISTMNGAGFTCFDNVKLDIGQANDAERAEILSLLSSGVYM